MKALRAYAWFYLLFLYAPILLLPIFALNDAKIIAFPLSGLTWTWFAELAQSAALGQAVRNSVLIAVTSSVIATALGVLAARAGARHRFRGKSAMMGFIMLPLVLPEIIIAIALLVIVVQFLHLPLSNLTVIAAHALICLPYSVAILSSAFDSLDPAIEEAAMDLGETRLSAFWQVTWPLIMPGVVSSLLIGFTISLDEFIIAFFLTGANPTMPVYIWSLLRFPGQLPVVMALGTVLVVISIILLSLAEIMRRRSLARMGQADSGGFL